MVLVVNKKLIKLRNFSKNIQNINILIFFSLLFYKEGLKKTFIFNFYNITEQFYENHNCLNTHFNSKFIITI